MKNMCATIFFIFCLVGCATVKPIPQEQFNKIKRIGIISVMGEKINLDHFGPTILNIESKKLEINFNTDQYIVKTFKQEIAQNTSIEIVDVEFDYNRVEKVNKAYKGFTNAYEAVNTIKEELREIVKKNSLDALVLVMKKQTPDLNLNNVDGAGFFEKDIVLYRECQAYMFAIAILIDGESVEPISNFGYYKHGKIEKEDCPKGLATFSTYQVDSISKWMANVIQDGTHDGLTLMGIQ